MSGCCSVAFGAKGRFHQMWAWWPNFSSMIIVQTNCIIQKCHTSLISCPNIIQKYRLVTEKSAVVLISHWTITLDYNCWCVCSRWPLPTTTMWGLLLHLLMSLNNRHMVSLNSLCLSLSPSFTSSYYSCCRVPVVTILWCPVDVFFIPSGCFILFRFTGTRARCTMLLRMSRYSVVRLYFCVLVTTLSPARTAKPIDMG